jgi:SnoaL-like domain
MDRDQDLAERRLLTDHHQIRQLLLQYFVNVDRRVWPPVKAIFVPGTLVDYSDLMPIPDALAAEDVVDRIEAAIALYSVTVHQMGNCDIDVAGDTAHSETWINAHHVYADPTRNEGRMPIAGLRYQDDWLRTPDGWRVRHRKAFTDWRSWWDHRPPTYVNGTHQ